MSSLTVVLTTLLAVFVGMSIPVLLQLRSTLRELQKRMASSGTRLDRILEDSEVVAQRLRRLSGGLEGGEESIRDLVVALGELSKVAIRTSGWMGVASSVGAAIGPAVAAAVHAFRAGPAYEETETDRDGDHAVPRETVSPPRAEWVAPGAPTETPSRAVRGPDQSHQSPS